MIKRLIWFWKCDRLGPDIPLTHVLLYFHKTGRWICRKKFKKFGDNSEFRPFAFAHSPSKISIGNNVKIHPGTVLSGNTVEGGTIIEDDVAIGHGVHFYPANHRYDIIDIPIKYQGHYCKGEGIRVCKGSWIGANCVILPGVTIGEHAVVGAGSIVTKSVEPYTVVAGNPAKLIKRIK